MTSAVKDAGTKTESEVDVSVDLSADVACTYPMFDCEVPAEWVGHARCGHWDRTYCDEHRGIMAFEAALNEVMKVVVCPVCETVPEIDWRRL